jgi:hypothetical protein
MRSGMIVVGVLLAGPANARAQRYVPEVPDLGFVEISGGWGPQFGETEYLPDGAPTEFQHPLVLGWSGGLTGGVTLVPDLALIASYEYRFAMSREGQIPQVLDSVRGKVRYHTAAIGMRLYRTAGMGRLHSDFAVGVLFPFETRLELDYGQALRAAQIDGTGTRVDEYGFGVGVQAGFGYEIPIAGPIYFGASLELRSFQSSNNNHESRLDNVVDLSGMPPVATTATIDHGDGKAQPTTYSVQDLSLHFAIGAHF